MSEVVTRFAPSPTGFLHIGGARTALFSYLLAKSQGGRFLLRIEDTDRERSTPEATQAILDAMQWLDLPSDGEIVYQHARQDRHNEIIDQLLASGNAYYCDCSKEQVDAMRERARAEGKKPKYDGTCRERGLEAGEGRVVRLKTPLQGSVAYNDQVKGPIAVSCEEMDDMILRRSDGTPTYNLAVVVDDHDMGVTHVLRGDDHVNNTPRQILIYRAMDWDVPEFGHVPMILGPDKKKLSKRHGALSVMEYEAMGYLPEAVVNYLARLGWSHGDQEVFHREELHALFSLDNLGSSPSVFDTKKLEWLNAQYIMEADPDRLTDLVMDVIRAEVGDDQAQALDRAMLRKAVPLLQPRAKTLVDMAEAARFFLVDAAYVQYEEKAVKKFLTAESLSLLAEYTDALREHENFSEEALEEMTKTFVESRGLKFKAIAQPIRVSITGRTASPGLFETMVVLGRDQTLARLNRVQDFGL
ncbi:glutamyl-tRNA synthetase [Paucidesulfovibrio gracilis DSM 16080]|uniref:Glutamate--tRNA ligase n=1 Tax=Paucidesulfovibrio gracilis DSM 16080 TaxID=1121449 RepID=A0A1T4W5W0_9BACT|nr:glutamate--tRNA ligase [Paucidesulfovibrio gracilis]SKA72425.1 glutamyl-tRNA synthetase [Paucidesulfovibrio gracilis DSM 16080]